MQKPILGLAAAALLAACGSNQALLAKRTQSEAQQLQQYCKKAGISNSETAKADQSLQSAVEHIADGKEDVATSESDLAATLFRLALARKELSDVQTQVEDLKKGLAKDKDQLATFQEILSEMKATRKP
jgi:septal ring factor EnvC (AmiA/AmiB activator)